MMSNTYYGSLLDAIEGLRAKGYTYDFDLEFDCLVCGEAIHLNPEDFTIDEAYKFEGDTSSADDTSIIFAISATEADVKGILIDAYGIYSEDITPELASKLKFTDSENV